MVRRRPLSRLVPTVLTSGGEVLPIPLTIDGLLAWHDASDSTTITSSGGLVTSWTDKSGNGNTLTAAGAERPTTDSRTIGGLNALEFDGGSTIIYNGSTPPICSAIAGATISDLTIFMVINSDDFSTDGNNHSRPFFIGKPSAGAGQVYTQLFDTEYNIYRRDETATVGIEEVTGSPLAISTNYILSWTIPSSDVRDTSFYRNNSLLTSAVATNNAAATGFTDLTHYCIGDQGTGSLRPWDGLIGEVLIYDSILSSDDLDSLYTYLGEKWGIIKQPDEISGLIGWYKGDAGVTKSGDDVTIWADQSGSGTNLTAPAGATAPHTRLVNGLTAIDFDGSDDYMSFSGGFVSDYTGVDKAITYIAVVQQDVAGAAQIIAEMDFSGTAQDLTNRIFVNAASVQTLDQFNSGTGGGEISASAVTPTNLAVRAFTRPTGGIHSSTLYENGGAIASNNSSANHTTNPTVDTFRLGASYYNGAFSAYFNGVICEICVYDSELTAEQVAQVSNALIAKWGI